ncbi:Cystathionine beta-synthase, core [Cynara cardunculus var. scolymus]|uniref:Cystathionine beta-synthase, core n=1 Tax=Cynara cardunculus var. scolymus TaxID=59895 RepID=A0A103YDJ9_CYNCS|nr:Cystathionine beta-synthase, core [Cynara cardunculus var. scolymus]
MAANDVPCCETMFWVYLASAVALVAFAGLMSGLTLGLMSLSLLDLEVLIKAGQPKDRKNAEKIMPIALPIFLDSILLPWTAILISVTLVVVFGEIIPQAVCSRYGLAIGAKLSVLVRLLVMVVFPIAYPLSKLLDLILGKGHSVLLRRAELKTLVDMHGNKAGKGGELTNDEITIITGALDLAQKTVKDAMTPISEIFSLELNSKLNEDTMSLLLSKGHSRVPVYLERPESIIGLILVKSLIKFRPEDEAPIKSLNIQKIPRIHECLPLYEMLNLFQKGQCHMAAVVRSKTALNSTSKSTMAKNETVKKHISSNLTQIKVDRKGHDTKLSIYRSSSDPVSQNPAPDQSFATRALDSFPNPNEEIIGVITMEDVLEELLQEPILDEKNEYVDVDNIMKINILPSSLRSGAASASSHLDWKTLVSSPLPVSPSNTPDSLHHQISALSSPISPFIQSPFTKPTLYASPRKSTPNSPMGLISSSPSSYKVSRKSYEKLEKPGNKYFSSFSQLITLEASVQGSALSDN